MDSCGGIFPALRECVRGVDCHLGVWVFLAYLQSLNCIQECHLPFLPHHSLRLIRRCKISSTVYYGVWCWVLPSVCNRVFPLLLQHTVIDLCRSRIGRLVVYVAPCILGPCRLLYSALLGAASSPMRAVLKNVAYCMTGVARLRLARIRDINRVPSYCYARR